jgi:hypothetical protein
MVRLQDGRRVLAAPVYLPGDSAIPVPEVPARAEATRPLQVDHDVLQRERKPGVAGWLWLAAGGVVLALTLAFLAALSWGVGRLARATAGGAEGGGPAAHAGAGSTPPAPRRVERTSTAAG